MISFCITSCNRWELLEKTVDSFLKLNNFPIEKYLLNEDSTDVEIIHKILKKYGSLFHIIRTPKNEGLLKAVDNLYALVDTDYIFHTEDDWLYETNSHFIEESLNILKDRKDIHQVWIRKDIPKEWIEKQNFGNYRLIHPSHLGGWCGFSWNPGLRRKKDYLDMFPEGFNKHRISKDIGISELECNNIAKAQGYRAAILTNPVCNHIGYNHATKREK